MKFTATSLITCSALAAVGAFAPCSNLAPPASKTPMPTKTALNGVLLNEVLDVIADKTLLERDENLSSETKLYVGKLSCALTKGLMLVLGQYFIDLNESGGMGTDADLKSENVSMGWKKIGNKWMKTKVNMRTHSITDDWDLKMLINTDLKGDQERNFIQSEIQATITALVTKQTRNEKFLDLDDDDFTFADNAQATRVLKDLKFAPGKAFPQTYNTDFNMQTDESFSRIFFHGIAAPIMSVSEEVTNPEHLKYGPYMVDLGFMSEFPLRSDLYKKYGARVHFDENQIVSAIYDSDAEKLFLRGDDGWEKAKMQAKVSAFTLATAREHLGQTHLIVSNDASREIVLNLHPEHPIRRLLAIFTWNAVGVNAYAPDVLINERGVLHRATPLTHEGIKAVFDNAYTTSIAYQPFTDRGIKNPKLKEIAYPTEEGRLSGFPYLSEGCEFYEIIRNMVHEWLDKAGSQASDEYALAFYDAMREASKGQAYELPEYSHDNMIDLISTVIFSVTAYHELVGHVPDYTILPNAAGLRIPKRDETQCDVQAFFLGVIITSTTSAPAPQLLAEFHNYIGVGGAPEWEKDVWMKFIAKMGLQTKKVQEAERKRAFEYLYFDPSLFECSVSV